MSLGYAERLSAYPHKAVCGLPVNSNMDVTPPNVRVAIEPHNDYNDILITQLQGRKRWRLWKMRSPVKILQSTFSAP